MPMEGGNLFAGRANLQECCEELGCSLINLIPYMKKSTLEAAIGCRNHESKGNMSKHSTNHGLLISMEAYAVKDL